MKAIGIVGFKNSGKTTLAIALARALKNKNYRVVVIKHSSKTVHHEQSDTGKLLKEVGKAVLITPESTEIIMSGKWDLTKIVPLLSADFLIIEGFKSLKYFPKILCLKEEKEKELLADGLELFTAGIEVTLKEKKIVNFLINEEKDLKKMVECIEEKGFLLADANCEKCGYKSCYGLAKAIIKGQESIQKCSYTQDYVSLKVNGKGIPLNQFMSKLYQSLIYGMLAPLKDIDSLEQAEIEIKANIFRDIK
jgi:molybdopterin-guanine dinucleotide biosynthesis protein B